MTIYINRKSGRDIETVDEFETIKDARAMCREYQIADYSAPYYTSTRACKAWRDSEKEDTK